MMKNLPKNKPIVIDLFSGAGGLSEGFRQAGFHILASVDSDISAAETQTYNHSRWKHFPTKIINKDINGTNTIIKDIKGFADVKIDLVIGGPPCQGFSLSNMQTRSGENPLNKMFEKFLKIVDEFKPTVFVLENVPGMNSLLNGEISDKVIASFSEIGYKTERETLNSVHYGVPQKRSRLFFVGTNKDITIQFPEKVITDPQKFVSVGEAISDLPSLENGNSIDERQYKELDDLSKYQKLMRKNGSKTVKNNLVSKNNSLVIDRYSYIKQGENWSSIPESLMTNYADKSRCHSGIYKRLKSTEPSVTIANFRKNMLIHPTENRGLSVREAARLQSFPDHFVFKGTISQQQQQVANAVPPLLAKAVGKVVKKLL